MAIGPIDYLSGAPQPLDFLKNIQGGLQVGGQIQQMQQLQAQQEQAKQAQAEYQSDIAQAFTKADPQSFAALSLKYPAQREAIKQSWDQLSEGDRKTEGDTMSQAYSALLSDRPDIAKAAIQRTIDARKNSGLDTSHYDAALQMVLTDPQKAKGTLGFTLSHINDPKAFATQYGALGTNARAEALAPSEQAKARADAVKAGADATVASSTVPQQIEKFSSDLLTAEQKRRLADFDAQISGADSETKRGQLTLEREKFVAEQGLKTQAVAADSQNQLDTIGNSIATVKSLRDDPLIGEWLGVGSTLGPFLSKIPGTRTKDFRAKVDTLKSQQFLTAAKEMKGMGALSDAEGARIERAVASLDPDQSPGAFKNALGIIQTTLERGEAKLRSNGKVPTAGGAFVMKHPTYGNVTEGDINRIISSRPGSTRQQAIDFLKSTGGQ